MVLAESPRIEATRRASRAAAAARVSPSDRVGLATAPEVAAGQSERAPDALDFALQRSITACSSQRLQRMQNFVSPPDSVTDPNYSANGVAGEVVSVRTDLGTPVAAWRCTDPRATLMRRFFCHGYAFGTFVNNGYTVFSGPELLKVIADEYRALGQIGTAVGVQAGDVIVFWKALDPVHSALVHTPTFAGGGTLDPATTTIDSKYGTGGLNVGQTLQHVMGQYADATMLEVYRRW